MPPGEPGPATVVDRPGWAQVNVDGFRVVLEPMTDRLFDGKQPGRLATAATARIAGTQMGAVLAWLSSKVLGQYEAFTAEGRPGRLCSSPPTSWRPSGASGSTRRTSGSGSPCTR